jgi:ABC-type uncharacterized transport system substrate-binding protein
MKQDRARYRLPAVCPWRFFPEVGGLLSYGADQRDEFRLAATYVDRILRGERAGELPEGALATTQLHSSVMTWRLERSSRLASNLQSR